MMKTSRPVAALILALVTVMALTSCASTPIGRMKQVYDIVTSPAMGAVTSSIEAIGEASEEITPENEYYIGRSVASAIIAQYPVWYGSPEVTAYLNRICGAITLNSSMPYLYRGYSVAIMDTDEINAMATPGGHIFVSRGLLKAVNSEDALAAVIAHEIAHIQLKHSISAIQASRITNALGQTALATAMVGMVAVNSAVGSDTGRNFSDSQMDTLLEVTEALGDITNQMVETLVNTGYSQAQEFEADNLALTLMLDAGYDPRAMLEMLSLIDVPGQDHGWISTHPAPKDRIEEVQVSLEDMSIPRIDRSARNARFAQYRI